MKGQPSHHAGVLSRSLVVGVLLLNMPHRSLAQPQSNMNAIQLGPGVLVDPGKDRAYVMAPDGGVKAIGALQGNLIWSSKAAPRPLKEVAKPLAIVADRLVVQVEAPASRNALQIASLSTADGSVAGSFTKTMPPGIVPTIAETARGRFMARAETAGDRAHLTWTFTQHAKRGLPPGVEEKLQPTEKPAVAASVPSSSPSMSTRGVFQLKVSTDRIEEATPPPALTPAVATQTQRSPSEVWSPKAVAAGDRVPDAKGRQFYSVDGRHIFSSDLIASGGPERYLLTIYDKESKKPIGKLKSRWSVLPFVVVRSRTQPDDWIVIYVTPAFQKGADSEPRKTRTLNLTTGKEIWSEPVRDTVDTGPSAP
jgi:hypothetical protein